MKFKFEKNAGNDILYLSNIFDLIDKYLLGWLFDKRMLKYFGNLKLL